MVDITNRDASLVPMQEDLRQEELQQPLTTTPAVESPDLPAAVEGAKLQNLEEIGEGEGKKEKNGEEKESEAALSSRFLRARRSFNTNALKDQIVSRLQPQAPVDSIAKQLSSTGAVVNRPISLLDERSQSAQTFAGSEREQIKMALAARFPAFLALPVAVQSAIIDQMVAEPQLTIEMAGLLIEFTETNSFQRLGGNDRQTAMKMMAALMVSPQFSDLSDGRLPLLIKEIVSGALDLRFYRSTTAEPGQASATTISINLGAPEMARALQAAMKGDSAALARALVALAREVPEARAQDGMWQSLAANPQFRALGNTQAGVYQALKQFPEAAAERLIEYAALPTPRFAAEPLRDRFNELKLMAAIDTDSAKGESVKGELGKSEGGEIVTKAPEGRRRPEGAFSRTPAINVQQLAASPLPLIERLMQGEVVIDLYRASDGKKIAVDKNSVRLNLSDPGVQRSLATDGKLAAGAVARLGAEAARALDTRVAELDHLPGFKPLDEASKRLIAGALNDYPEADVDQLMQFAQSPSFLEQLNKSGRERAHAMRFIASMLHNAAHDDKKLTLLYQSLARLFNNDIQFTGFLHENGYASSSDGGGIAINGKYWLDDEMEGMATLVTEVNNALHERPDIGWGGTIAHFAAEYRSAYLEAFFRTNEAPRPEYLRQFVAGLLNAQPSSVYAHMRHTYETDEVFQQLVSWINGKLDDGEAVKPEELRQMLITMSGRSPNIAGPEHYQQPWTIDNESPFPDASAVLARVAGQMPLDRLTPAEQSIVVNMVRKYEAAPAAFHRFTDTPLFRDSDESARAWLLRIAGALSAAAASESEAAHALDLIVSGRVRVALCSDETDSRQHWREGDSLRVNITACRRSLTDDWIIGFSDSAVAAIVK